MAKWSKLREKISSKTLTSKTWRSDYKGLLSIIEAAEDLGIDPEDANNASLSNLRTIIRVAKDAIKDEDGEKLATLFRLAATLSTGELRVEIGTHKPEEVAYEEITNNDSTVYRVVLDAKQFERLKTSTQNRFTYKRSVQ